VNPTHDRVADAQRLPTVATYRIHHVTDGDTVVLRNGQRVPLVQIDTPRSTSAPSATGGRRLSSPSGCCLQVHAFGSTRSPRPIALDDYGRLLRYVVRAKDGVNVNVALVAVGAAAPYFYEGRRGKYASRLEIVAKSAKAKHLGLWGACPHTAYNPYHGIETRR
jgi:endonuclease YncB( thermonuclease family)